jgi:general secretion pathway protein H
MSRHAISRRAKHEMSGFTLLEMLVVLAILSLIVTVVPPLIRAVAGPNARSVGHAVAADLRLLRDEAIRQDAITAFVPDDKGYVLKPSGQAKHLPAGLALSFDAAPSYLLPATDVIEFFPDGSATGGVLRLVRKGLAVRILVRSVDGRVRFDD